MSRYEQRLDQDLTGIRESVVAVGQDVLVAFQDALHAVLVHDKELASQIILNDLPINRASRSLDARCHSFVARHLPSAGPLRFVSSVLRINVALERIGDYAVTIAREQTQLQQSPPPQVARDIDLIGDQAKDMLSTAIKAFAEENTELARGTKGSAKALGRSFERIFADLISTGEAGERTVSDLFALLVILNRISRVSDQAKNLCEETIFAGTGETKVPKQYRILFVGDTDDGLSQVAVAYANRAFPQSGVYSSAGLKSSEAVLPSVVEFLVGQGYEPPEGSPTDLDHVRDDMSDFHVVVALNVGRKGIGEAGSDKRTRIGKLPFHTTLIQWQMPSDSASLEEQYRFLCCQIGDLMELLRGQGAS